MTMFDPGLHFSYAQPEQVQRLQPPNIQAAGQRVYRQPMGELRSMFGQVQRASPAPASLSCRPKNVRGSMASIIDIAFWPVLGQAPKLRLHKTAR